jgi:TPR repeat protein
LDIEKQPLNVKSSAAEALFETGYKLLVGPKEGRDRAQAQAVLLPLAEAGHVGAQGLLGIAHFDEDPAAAALWFKKAQPELLKMARAGLPLAAWLLGVMNEKACGVRQNWTAARKWYESAGHMGHDLSAQQNSDLAMRMNDWNETLYWALISERLGIAAAETHTTLAESHLSEEKIAPIRKRASAWQQR